MVYNFHHSFCTAEQPRDAAMLRFQIGRALRGEAGAQQNTAIEVKLFDYDEADPSIDKLLIGTGVRPALPLSAGFVVYSVTGVPCSLARPRNIPIYLCPA